MDVFIIIFTLFIFIFNIYLDIYIIHKLDILQQLYSNLIRGIQLDDDDILF